MAFHFALKGLLRVRESFEKAELLRLQTLAAAAQAARAEIEAVEFELQKSKRRVFETVIAKGASGAELQFEAVKEAAWNALRAQLIKKLAGLEQKRQEQQGRYVQARRLREIISNLREKQLAEYELAMARREQQRIDELFLIRGASAAAKNAETGDVSAAVVPVLNS